MASVATSIALIPVPVRAVPLIHVRPVEADPQGITVGELCEQFLASKRKLLQLGELCARSVESYERIFSRLLSTLGPNKLVDDLLPADFMRLRESLAQGNGPVTLTKSIQSCRTLFKFAYESCLIDSPIRFGPNFRKPAARVIRLSRQARVSQMLEADEVRRLLEASPPVMQAMIILGINCGYGPSDCGQLPLAALDLKMGVVNFGRPKTGIQRSAIPLWPETIAAIKRAMVLRPKPHTPEVAGLVFLTGLGRCWSYGNNASTLTKKFKFLKRRCGITRNGVGFYALRRCFETIGGESLDQAAVDYIMGHCPRSDDMAAIYRVRLSAERLKAVTEHVRKWLFPTDNDNPIAIRQKAAAEILASLNGEFSSTEVKTMLKRLGTTQSELCVAIKISPSLLSHFIAGRMPLSQEIQRRCKDFLSAVAAEGGAE